MTGGMERYTSLLFRLGQNTIILGMELIMFVSKLLIRHSRTSLQGQDRYPLRTAVDLCLMERCEEKWRHN